MNAIQIKGSLVDDPTVYISEDGDTVTRLTLAVDRPSSRDEEPRDERSVDYIMCIAFGSGFRDFAEKYLARGIPLLISGSLQNSASISPDSELDVPFSFVLIDSTEFCEKKEVNDSYRQLSLAETKAEAFVRNEGSLNKNGRM